MCDIQIGHETMLGIVKRYQDMELRIQELEEALIEQENEINRLADLVKGNIC